MPLDITNDADVMDGVAIVLRIHEHATNLSADNLNSRIRGRSVKPKASHHRHSERQSEKSQRPELCARQRSAGRVERGSRWVFPPKDPQDRQAAKTPTLTSPFLLYSCMWLQVYMLDLRFLILSYAFVLMLYALKTFGPPGIIILWGVEGGKVPTSPLKFQHVITIN